jgi:methylated-DNA-[protein]-cysteine S-methyltransferase
VGAHIGVRVEASGLVAVDLLPSSTTLVEPSDPLAREVARQLRAYFADPDQHFDLPLAARGTPYQNAVWAYLRRIPRGRAETYGAVARAIGGSPRAVGGACRANPVPVVVPCHRVVAAHGRGGYMGEMDGAALAVKRWLLAHEGLGEP